jgi:hypothetical protein
MLLTGDGQHLAVIFGDGQLALLRPRAGDYARSILGETAAVGRRAIALDAMPGARLQSGWLRLQHCKKAGAAMAHIGLAFRLYDSSDGAGGGLQAQRYCYQQQAAALELQASLAEGGWGDCSNRPAGWHSIWPMRRISSVAEGKCASSLVSIFRRAPPARAEQRAKEKAARASPPLSKNDAPKPQ